MMPSGSRSAMLRRLALGAVAGIGLAAVAGCASSYRRVDTWKDPTYPSRPLSNVLVVGMRKGLVQRRLWEDDLTAALDKQGIHATPSYRLFPDAAPDSAQVRAVVHRDQYDGLVMVRELPTEQERYYVPGTYEPVPVTGFNPWWGTYYAWWADVYTPGYVRTEQIARYQIDVWSTRDGGPGHLVWAGVSEHINPTSGRDVQKLVSRYIVPQLVKTRVIATA